MAAISALDFVVNRGNLQQTNFVEKIYSDELSPNQVLLAVDRFSFTSNNITYGILGERMNYWQFFPAQTGYGIVPVWGFADVIASNHPEVTPGQRYYGYFPMSTHLMVTVDRLNSMGFVDSSPHRKALPAVYNFYTNTANDPTITPATEAMVALFRPLFITSFLIDLHLAEHDFYNATHVLFTSASSKTAQVLAYLLAHRKETQSLPLKLIGLTSKKNVEFVQQLGWYDETISYHEAEQLNTDEKYVLVDFAGNHSTQYQLQTLLDDQLLYNCLVGLVDWQNLKGEKPLPKKGDLFFAPTHAARRQQEWGIPAFLQKSGAAWQNFVAAIQSDLTIREFLGREQVQRLYLDMLKGHVDPQSGNMASLKDQ